jgi:BRCA1-associated protein
MPAKKSQVLFLLAIPNDFALSELAIWLGSAVGKIQAIKLIVLKETIGFYSAVLFFDSQVNCESVYEVCNGRLFRESSSEVALLVFVSQIFYIHIKCLDDPNIIIKDSLQLPRCPLCIERLDVTISGLSTLSSGNMISYIYSLNKKSWEECEKSCKVCKVLNHTANDTVVGCSCGIKESVWICLICGYLGCGRYQNEHAAKHFKETGHVFAVDMESGRIWDYTDDKYVHRILKGNNPYLIEADEDHSLTPENPEELTDKIENTLREYNHLLTAQLEDQRNYFESRLKNAKKAFEETEEVKSIHEGLESINKRITEIKAHRKNLFKENATLEKQNELLKAKIADTEKFLLLRLTTKENLLKEMEELSKSENEENKEDPRITKKLKIIEDLEKELAALYKQI